MSDIILIKGKILIDTADIQDIRGFEYLPSIESERKDKEKQASHIPCLSDYQGKPDYDLSGKFVVRVYNNAPFIDIVCDTLPEAQQLYKNILKSRHVVDINEVRYGK